MRRVKLLRLLAALAVLGAGCVGPFGSRPPLMTSPDYGIQVFLWGQPDTTERDLELVKKLGFRWVKQMFQWNYIEGKGKGQFEWNEPDRVVDAVQKTGLKLLARVDIPPDWALPPDHQKGTHGPPANPQDFGDFLSALARRYRGRIQAYQIWNEPNLAREWGGKSPDPQGFVELLKVAYQAIKSADPDALVISGGLSPTTAPPPLAVPDIQYLREMYRLGAQNYFDALGVHAAGFKAPPEMDPDEVARNPELTNYDKSPVELKRSYSFRHVEDYRKVMVEFGDDKKQIVILEFGWTFDPRPNSPYRWHAVTPEQQAEYVVRAYRWAAQNWRPWVGLMSLIYICAPYWTPNDEQYYWSITDEKGNPRPAYLALQAMEKVQ
jgi:hypothetical protein